jgi:tetratricopeptide (TPR) repeat protein
MLLSAALIVKNEEKFLGTCLRSLTGLADEVVVVDTGSTDRTADIAIAEGARLYHRPWTGDFSAARNEALDLARGDWILYIDADERVSGGDPELVRAQLRAARYIGYRVQLRPRPGFTPYWEMRLFRNHPQIRFRGVIHENIWPALNERQAQSGGRIGHTELVLDHDGYEGDQAAKHLRNQPLLEQSLADDPSRVYSQCHLATIREALGDAAGAEQAWGTAMRLVRGKQTRQPEDVLPFLHEIERGLAAAANPLGQPDRLGLRDPLELSGPLKLLDEALALFPGQLQLLWLRARALIAAGRVAEATGVLKELVRLGRSGEFDKSWAYDLRLFGVLAYELLAACYFGEGSYVDALRYFELAAAAEPANLEYRVKATLCRRLLATPAATEART